MFARVPDVLWVCCQRVFSLHVTTTPQVQFLAAGLRELRRLWVLLALDLYDAALPKLFGCAGMLLPYLHQHTRGRYDANRETIRLV